MAVPDPACPDSAATLLRDSCLVQATANRNKNQKISMIYGIGVDLIEIERIKHVLTRTGQRFITRVYTEAEQQYCSTKHPPYACYAARFVAKEAFLKALGTGLRQHMRWRDIAVYRNALGKPSLHVSGYLQEQCLTQGIRHIHLSLAHSTSMAIAQVILEC
jgi:holo-[acyl-carrier protein] synthase